MSQPEEKLIGRVREWSFTPVRQDSDEYPVMANARGQVRAMLSDYDREVREACESEDDVPVPPEQTVECEALEMICDSIATCGEALINFVGAVGTLYIRALTNDVERQRYLAELRKQAAIQEKQPS